MKRTMVNVVFILSWIVMVTSPAFSQSKNPIKIGGSLGITGLFSEQCKWIKRGYETWVEDVNKRGGLLGRPVELTIYDDEGMADKAVTYYDRVITVDKADLVSGGYPATTNVALMALCEKYKKVFISMGGQMPSFSQGYTYSFGSPPLMTQWVKIALVAILEDLIPRDQWPKSLAIMTMNNVVGLTAREAFINSAKEHGIKVVVDETYNLPLSDATPMVSKARGKRAELLVEMSFFDDAVMITSSAKAMNYRPKLIFQLLASAIPAWMKEMGPDGNNTITFHWWNNRLRFPGCEVINGAAKKKYNLPGAPTYFGLGYCWMKTLELAVKGAGSLNHKEIRDYLRSHKFDLPYGTGISFDEKGLPAPFTFLIQTTNGRNEIIWPKEQATAKFVYPRPKWSR